MDQNQIKENWESRGFSCNLWSDPPGKIWENYIHDTDELLMLMKGEIELEIAGKISHPKIGEEVFIPASTYHSVRNQGKVTNSWFYGYRRSLR